MEFEGNVSDSGFVFCRVDGEHVRHRFALERHKAILAAAEFPFIPLKNLRHTVASTLLGRKHSLKVVADLLGHSTIKVTADTYSHVAEGIHAEAVADFGNAMDPSCCAVVASGRDSGESQAAAVDANSSSDED